MVSIFVAYLLKSTWCLLEVISLLLLLFLSTAIGYGEVILPCDMSCVLWSIKSLATNIALFWWQLKLELFALKKHATKSTILFCVSNNLQIICFFSFVSFTLALLKSSFSHVLKSLGHSHKIAISKHADELSRKIPPTLRSSKSQVETCWKMLFIFWDRWNMKMSHITFIETRRLPTWSKKSTLQDLFLTIWRQQPMALVFTLVSAPDPARRHLDYAFDLHPHRWTLKVWERDFQPFTLFWEVDGSCEPTFQKAFSSESMMTSFLQNGKSFGSATKWWKHKKSHLGY